MISIVIPTLNEEKYLPNILNDLKKQSFKDFEIIVSDANSEDKTGDVARLNSCKFILSKKEDRHPSIQRNNGAKIAQGDLILFLDADTRIFDKEFIKKTVDYFYKENLVIAGFFIDFQNKKLFYRFYYFVYNNLAYLAQKIKPLALGAGIIIKKDIHFKLNGFDQEVFIGEDQLYCEKAAKFGKFSLIKNTKIFFSTRRFEKEGPWRLFFKLVYSTLYVLIFGPIKKKIINYDFGNFKSF